MVDRPPVSLLPCRLCHRFNIEMTFVFTQLLLSFIPYNYTSQLVTMIHPNNEILSKTTLLWIGVGAAGGAGVALGAQGVANIAQVDICFKWTITHWNMALNVLDHFQMNIYLLKCGSKCLGSFSSEHLSIEILLLMSWIIFKWTFIHGCMAFKVLDLFQVNIYPLKCGF